MNEFLKINDTLYECTSITPDTKHITFSLAEGDIASAVILFRNTTCLEVCDAEKNVYGVYDNLTFGSVTMNSDGVITICMILPSNEDSRIAELEAIVESQNTVINDIDALTASLIYGGEE